MKRRDGRVRESFLKLFGKIHGGIQAFGFSDLPPHASSSLSIVLHASTICNCMPQVRFQLRAPCSTASSIPSSTPIRRIAVQQIAPPPPPPAKTARTRILGFHTKILRMNGRSAAETEASPSAVPGSHDLKLVNRLSESRSPYVSLQNSPTKTTCLIFVRTAPASF